MSGRRDGETHRRRRHETRARQLHEVVVHFREVHEGGRARRVDEAELELDRAGGWCALACGNDREGHGLYNGNAMSTHDAVK